jgi:hypothetical protein
MERGKLGVAAGWGQFGEVSCSFRILLVEVGDERKISDFYFCFFICSKEIFDEGPCSGVGSYRDRCYWKCSVAFPPCINITVLA